MFSQDGIKGLDKRLASPKWSTEETALWVDVDIRCPLSFVESDVNAQCYIVYIDVSFYVDVDLHCQWTAPTWAINKKPGDIVVDIISFSTFSFIKVGDQLQAWRHSKASNRQEAG